MAFLYGRAGRLTAKHGGFRPGQGVPAAFTSSSACGAGTTQPKLGKCGLTPPDATIIRTPDGNLLAAFYGYASDGYLKGALYTTAYFSSTDGLTSHGP